MERNITKVANYSNVMGYEYENANANYLPNYCLKGISKSLSNHYL